MARQKGIIPIEGTIDNITFYKTQDGFMAKKKTGISPERIATDPAFQRTRENGQEFSRAGKAAKLVRSAFRSVAVNVADNRMINRLIRIMVAAIRLDQTNPRGQRNVIDGETVLLEGFEFNKHAALGSVLFASFTHSISRATGEMNVSFQKFVPQQAIEVPQGATHFKLVAAGAELDFLNDTYIQDVEESPVIPWDNQLTNLFSFTCTVTAASSNPLFLALGVLFYQEVNGQYYALKNGDYNTLAIIGVDA